MSIWVNTVHHGAVVRDVERQDGVDGAGLVVEDVMRQRVDGIGLGALRDAHREHVVVDVEDVAALDVERVVAAVVLGGALQHGMMREDVLAVDGLAVAGLGVHAVDGHAVADHRERVAGEVQVRHGLDDHLGRLGNQVHQRVGLVGVQLGEVDALHRLQHEVLGVGIVLLHVVEDDLLVAVRADAGLFDPLLEELLAQLGVGLENLSHEVFQVKHFDAVVAQSLRERVMLLLGDLQERDVVEQQLFERVRRQVQKLFSRAVQQDFLQGLDLALDVHS